jgi:hypothetical protein
MRTNEIPGQPGRGIWPTPSAAGAIAETPRHKRHGRLIIMLFSLLATALILAMATTSCAPIPCASGYPDPHWCEHHSSGGDGSGS